MCDFINKEQEENIQNDQKVIYDNDITINNDSFSDNE